MSANLDNRVKRLEQHQAASGADYKPWCYWDDYTPEQRKEMEGRVRWIVVVRPEQGHDQS